MSFTLGQIFSSWNPINEPFLHLDSPLWKELEGGYKGTKYDASVALLQLQNLDNLKNLNSIYQELWNELHHQGDVGIASYYAVPHLIRIAREKHLIDFNILSLVSVIEIQRHKGNPALPKAFIPSYNKAIAELEDLAKLAMEQDCDLELTSAILTAIAIAKGQTKLANAILNMDDEDVLDEFLEQF